MSSTAPMAIPFGFPLLTQAVGAMCQDVPLHEACQVGSLIAAPIPRAAILCRTFPSKTVHAAPPVASASASQE
eukprot:7530587-Prorocentrum_lima.AAC.1